MKILLKGCRADGALAARQPCKSYVKNSTNLRPSMSYLTKHDTKMPNNSVGIGLSHIRRQQLVRIWALSFSCCCCCCLCCCTSALSQEIFKGRNNNVWKYISTRKDLLERWRRFVVVLLTASTKTTQTCHPPRSQMEPIWPRGGGNGYPNINTNPTK